MQNIIVGITGASGSCLAKHLIIAASEAAITCHIVMTPNGRRVFEFELGQNITEFLTTVNGAHILYDAQDFFAPIASGSFDIDGMVVLPCSMGSAAKIAHGISDSLLLRVADVMLKERRMLIIVPRETPLSSIHLRNLLTLSEAGALIMPPVPAYYQHPQTIDEASALTAGRILNSLGIKSIHHKVWEGK